MTVLFALKVTFLALIGSLVHADPPKVHVIVNQEFALVDATIDGNHLYFEGGRKSFFPVQGSAVKGDVTNLETCHLFTYFVPQKGADRVKQVNFSPSVEDAVDKYPPQSFESQAEQIVGFKGKQREPFYVVQIPFGTSKLGRRAYLRCFSERALTEQNFKDILGAGLSIRYVP